MALQRYIVSRLFQAALALVGVTLIVFIATRMTGDPVYLLLPPQATEQDAAVLRQEMGLDRPLVVQYGVFLSKALRGDFGESYRWRQPALELVAGRLPATFQLTVAALLLTVIVAVPVGVLSATWPGSWFDRFGKALALLGQAIPVFWLGLILILVFSVNLRLFPTGGKQGLSSIVLPAVTLGWYSVAAITRLTRSAMLDVLGSEYIKLARLKGLPEMMVVGKHALKNAAIPVVTVLGLQMATLLGGAVITETIFSWPGVGRLTVDAIYARDFPVVQTAVLMTSAIFVLTNLAVDLLYVYLDPRIRYT